MHWHILGAGAIGLLWAAKLEKAGHRVSLILHTPEKLAHYHQVGGFTLTDNNHTERFTPSAQLADQPDPISHLLITTKSFAVTEAFASIQHRLSNHAQVLLLHNGMGPQQQLAANHPQLEIWAGSTTDGAYFERPILSLTCSYWPKKERLYLNALVRLSLNIISRCDPLFP